VFNLPLVRKNLWLASMFNYVRFSLKKFIRKYWSFVLMLLSLDFLNQHERLDICDVLLFCHDVDRPIDLCGKAYSPLLDSIREDLEDRRLTCKSIAHVGSYLIGKKGHGEPLSMNHAYILYSLRRKISNLFGLSIKFENNPYAHILEKTGAKLVLTIGSTTELASAAKFKGIYHVELLHGIGYSCVPWNWDELSSEYLPHGILSLDEISTKSLAPLKEKGIEIREIPNPFLKRFAPKSINLQPAEWSVKLDNLREYKASILVSLSWGYSGDHGPYRELANILPNGLFFDEISELVSEEQNIFWHFRFHPVQLRMKRYKKLLDFMDDFVMSHTNSEWVEATRVPFPSIAMHCDGNITMSSMSCYDAAAVGIRSLVICPTTQINGINQNLFFDLEKESYVTKLEADKEKIRNWVHQTRKVKPRLSNLEDHCSYEDTVEWLLQKSGLHQRG